MSMTPKDPKIIAILAGGKAIRFGGQDKGEIMIRGERLIDIIHRRLLPQSNEIIVSGRHDYELGIEYIHDRDGAPGGPVGGLYSIWAELKARDIEGFFTAAIDGPNLPFDLSVKLYSENASTIAADEQGRHPTYGWWRMKDLAFAWETLGGETSISLNKLADFIGAESIEWAGDKVFVNINRPEDLNKL